MTIKVPMSRFDNLTNASPLRKKWEHYCRLERLNKKLEDYEETVILDAIDITTFLEETENLGYE